MSVFPVIPEDYFYKEAAKILDGGPVTMVGDSEVHSHTQREIEELQALMYNSIQANYLRAGVKYQTTENIRQDMKIIGDEFLNPITGVGTYGDPNRLTTSSVPVMMGPMEPASMYANGGLPAIIIDKKSKALVSTGVTFKTYEPDFWDHEKIQMLEESAELTGFNATIVDNIRDCLLYGGTSFYPIFKGDSTRRFMQDLNNMTLEKGCITRWVSADRWNIVYVPSYIITAEDYLRPKSVYLPLGGYAVHTSRLTMLRPKTMPYWALLYNMGWSPSDYCGYYRALYAYQMVVMAVPIMAQQMSLVLYQMPLDAITAQMGPETVKKLMTLNEEKMQEWSILHPKAINMVGEVTTIDRTFSGFDMFIGSIKSDVASQSGIPEPSLFHTPNKGFSDNTQEALLKDSETSRMLQRNIEPQLIPAMDALVAHVFGTDSEEWNQRRKIKITFDQPQDTTAADLAEIGARFAATVASLATAGVPPKEAIQLAQQFFKTVDVRDDQFEAIEEAYERQMKLEEESAKQKAMMPGGGKKAGGGSGHSIASPGNASNTGHFTKPKSRIK